MTGVYFTDLRGKKIHWLAVWKGLFPVHQMLYKTNLHSSTGSKHPNVNLKFVFSFTGTLIF